MLSIIAAASENNIIGQDGKIPWEIQEDANYFAEKVKEKTVIVGMETYLLSKNFLSEVEKIIIITHKQFFISDPRIILAHTIAEAVKKVNKEEEAFIIGGAQIYEQMMEFADKIYLTRIHKNFTGDAIFPEVSLGKWNLIQSRDSHENNLDYTFEIYEKVGETSQ